MSKIPRILTRKNAVVGYTVSKFGMPYAKRALKRKLKTSAQDSAKGGMRALKRNPGKSSIAIGSLIGAVGFLLSHRKNKSDE